MTYTTDDYKQISIFWLKSQGLVKPDHWASGNIVWNRDQFTVHYTISTKPDDLYINLSYSLPQTDSAADMISYRIPLTVTPCRIGGIRFWFVCPLITDGNVCNRRVGIIYKAGKYFGCRRCYRLQYHSQTISYRKPVYAALHVLNTYERIGKVEQRKQWYAGKPTRHFNLTARLWHRAQPYIRQMR